MGRKKVDPVFLIGPGLAVIGDSVNGDCCDHHIHRDRRIPFPTMSNSAISVEPSTKKPLYEASTQFRNWRFSNEQLAQKRSVLNVAAVEAVRMVIENNTACQPAVQSASYL